MGTDETAAMEAGTSIAADGPEAASVQFDNTSVKLAMAEGDMSLLRIKDGACASPGGRGRPRSREAHIAILTATLELLVDVGYEGLSMEAVAQRAHVSKATIYRRWESKPALVLELLESIAASHTLPDTGSTRDDLIAFMTNVVMGIGHSQYGAIITGFAAELQRHPDLAETFREKFLAPRRAASLELLQRGIDRGDIRPDVDLELVIDFFVAPLYYRRMIAGIELDDGLPERMVDHILRGIAR